MNKIIENLKTSYRSLANFELSDIKLQEANSRLLDLSDLDLDQHIAMHSPAIAYYGSLYKQAARNLRKLKHEYEKWEKKAYHRARANFKIDNPSHKPTLDDIRSQIVVDNEGEMGEFDDRIDQAQFYVDLLEIWFEAWKTKGFYIKLYAGVMDEEKFSSGDLNVYSKNESHPVNLVDRVREKVKKLND
tara:strand:- start:704 stop:1267 length:564 start_codon:yes stop_codon:yes gene_type:complete